MTPRRRGVIYEHGVALAEVYRFAVTFVLKGLDKKRVKYVGLVPRSLIRTDGGHFI